jgi:hypothetical protein
MPEVKFLGTVHLIPDAQALTLTALMHALGGVVVRS